MGGEIKLKLERYKESGKFTLVGVLMLLVMSVLASAVLGVAYAYAIHYIPLVYLNLLCVGGVGFAISFIMKKVAKATKVRNKVIVTLFSFITAVLTVYIQWVVWLRIVFEGELYWKPLDVYNAILYVMPYGTWSIGSSDINGIELGIIWILEACVMIGIPLWTSAIKEIYCEECNNWVKNEKNIKYAIVGNLEHIKNEFEQGNFEILSTLEKLSADYAESHLALKFGICSECQGTAYASLENVSIRYNKKGEVTKEEKPVVKTVVLSKQKYNDLSNL